MKIRSAPQQQIHHFLTGCLGAITIELRRDSEQQRRLPTALFGFDISTMVEQRFQYIHGLSR
jgi:hypothetical protein